MDTTIGIAKRNIKQGQEISLNINLDDGKITSNDIKLSNEGKKLIRKKVRNLLALESPIGEKPDPYNFTRTIAENIK